MLRFFQLTFSLLFHVAPVLAFQLAQTDTIVTPSSSDTAKAQQVDLGYVTVSKTSITGAVAVLEAKDFNRGNIYDPTQLWEGRVAGLRISNRGGDPNSKSIIQVRGLSSLQSGASPLIVIDGVPAATLDNIDPYDIESITVLKDASAAALYGMRGSNGVLLISTKTAKRDGKLYVEYNSYGSRAKVARTQPVLSSSEYITAGGNNLGSSTNWQKEITQTGFSTGHHIGLSAGDGRNAFRVSGNFRNVRGALQKSGFDQVNIRGMAMTSTANGRLKGQANISYTDRKSNFSFPEAFKYATMFSPTAPIYNSVGDYYQPLLFDNYNPVALLNQNISTGKRTALNYNVKIDFAILKNLTLTVNAGHQTENNSGNTYYSRRSLYQGFDLNGLAERTSSDESFSFVQAHAFYSGTTTSGSTYSLLGGYALQTTQSNFSSLQGTNFQNDDGYNSILHATGTLSGYSNSSPHQLTAFFLRGSLALKNGISFNSTIRSETSSLLSSVHKNGLFGSAGMSVDLLHNIANPSAYQLKARLGYGVTGSPGNYSDASYSATISTTGGPLIIPRIDLTWEKLREVNMGVDFVVASKISGSVELYDRKASDLIQYGTKFFSGTIYTSPENTGGLKSRGIEFTVNYNSIPLGKVSWVPGVVLSSNRQILDANFISQELRGYADGPGMGGTQFTKVAVGEKIGQLWGPVFDGVAANGTQKFKDINGDGIVNANPGAGLSPNADYKTLGYGLPTLELGWSNLFTFRGWELMAFFRGAFGHSLLNETRMLQEPRDPGAINSYNRVSTNKAVAGLTFSQYSSLYVERADFIKLDNLMISYRFRNLETSWLKNLRLSAGAQNLFVITKYTGTDPDPILADPVYNGNQIAQSDPLVAGIDRRAFYYPVRTFTAGINLVF